MMEAPVRMEAIRDVAHPAQTEAWIATDHLEVVDSAVAPTANRVAHPEMSPAGPRVVTSARIPKPCSLA